LLRATDVPLTEGQDVTKLEVSSLSSTNAILHAGLNKMESLVKSYTKKDETETSKECEKTEGWTAVDDS